MGTTMNLLDDKLALTPADIRADLGLATTEHDELISVAITCFGFSLYPSAAQMRREVARACREYPEIDRALLDQELAMAEAA